MKIGVLGTGMVGETLATKFVQIGHEVTMGSRTAKNEHAIKWVQNNGDMAHNGTFADAAAFGEIVLNATKGNISIDALNMAGKENLNGKVLIDVANIINTEGNGIAKVGLPDGDSLGEQIQREFPDAKVVKTFNTLNCLLMVDPMSLSGKHVVFLSGNDVEAKETVRFLLYQMAWTEEQVVDLGDITTARGPEMYLALWLRMMQAFSNPQFNIAVVK